MNRGSPFHARVTSGASIPVPLCSHSGPLTGRPGPPPVTESWDRVLCSAAPGSAVVYAEDPRPESHLISVLSM
jgi:hypothetical protein